MRGGPAPDGGGLRGPVTVATHCPCPRPPAPVMEQLGHTWGTRTAVAAAVGELVPRPHPRVCAKVFH